MGDVVDATMLIFWEKSGQLRTSKGLLGLKTYSQLLWKIVKVSYSKKTPTVWLDSNFTYKNLLFIEIQFYFPSKDQSILFGGN